MIGSLKRTVEGGPSLRRNLVGDVKPEGGI